ncbi:MAG: UDP-N-acetylglucosamine 2-epimerase (non-hydrolyzing) [Deltaproteobacteria bacterium]|nr:UDP-N-acetylglucosamine 2-epimerase (non-hydrolyzing) [Deltaproteobacteria bacterium]
MAKIFLVTAARPNFMKVAPLFHSLKEESWADPRIIHTGQHYDLDMSDSFFKDLLLPQPQINLGIGSGTHAEQTGNVMIAFERVVSREQPDLVVVVGDVNSTMACTIAAVKSDCKVAHLEAGLRSFDRNMPEEINRIVTDTLSDVLWTPSPDADQNLLNEGIKPEKIKRVGNIMIDSLELLREKIEEENMLEEFRLDAGNYAVVTLHRPINVDTRNTLKNICDVLEYTASKCKVIFPVHPRTEKSLKAFGLYSRLDMNDHLIMVTPLSYVKFMSLVFNSKFLITDSGGIQEETTYLGIPCLTLRESTERPITVSMGTNHLCNIENIYLNIDEVFQGHSHKGSIPELWDGHTAERVVKDIHKRFEY